MRCTTQDPKYDIEVTLGGARLVDSATGKPIPSDCPIFMLLAKDQKAVPSLYNYRNDCDNAEQVTAVEVRLEEFEQYAMAHSDEMNEPDMTPNLVLKRGEFNE